VYCSKNHGTKPGANTGLTTFQKAALATGPTVAVGLGVTGMHAYDSYWAQ